ncbi:MAG: ATP-binding cassette domain-containing protein [Armatimonadota bacterium]
MSIELLYIMIDIRDVSKTYKGGITALKNVNFTVEKNEIFGLLGPNGAGKTTLMKILTTLIRPTKGTAYINGLKISRDDNKIRNIIGYVPQEVSIQRDLTAYENLLFYAKLYGVPRSERKIRIDSALELMELSDRANDLVKFYSGGMMRRLEMAESLINYPKILFLDEPTIGLDPLARKKVWEKILHLHKEHKITIFINTHYMNEAEEYCDRIAIINLGKIMIMDTPDKLKKSAGFNASMDDVFVKYTGQNFEEASAKSEFSQTARLRQRMKK